MDLSPEQLAPSGAAGLLVMLAIAVIKYLRDRVRQLETELREARRLHLSDLRKLRSRTGSTAPPPSR